jgi:V/A-type H+-transporting ATPase subunit D
MTLLLLHPRPTRGELLLVKRRIRLAKRGQELLKKKQDSLIIEFFSLLRDIQKERTILQNWYTKALRQMSEGRALESDLRIQAAALTAQETAPITLSIKTIAGVKIPIITRQEELLQRTPYDTLMLQDLGHAYLDVVNQILVIAGKETALRTILLEIRKTKRRAQALEHILIPQLEKARDHIVFELGERERENFSRLKHRQSP